MSNLTENKMLAQISAFKGEDDVYCDAETLEVVDVNDTEAEISFDHIRGERIYIRFNVAELTRLIHAYGRKPE